MSDSKPGAPLTVKELQATHKSLTVKRGQWRIALLKACERIEDEDGVPGPEPKPILDRLAYRFIRDCLEKRDLGYYKELGDRLDGKPPQALSVEGENGETITGVKVVFVGNTG
jgi:hypothetical protein